VSVFSQQLGAACVSAQAASTFVQGKAVMATFEIEQYEVHTQTYHVEAVNEAEAIKNFFAGDGDAIDNGLDYIEVADNLGLPAEQHPQLADAVRAANRTVTDVIPSIRRIEEV
jgi:hypothetical protein